ncbi:WGR domain-containing protein [Paracoccus litorisediminis]|uniref:WGR domain-containing protein n=1 Tax=Paracoccus litorisediminis TaxID=2006130 RepID=UPI0037315AB6
MDIYLERVDPERNYFRFYAILTTPDLFAENSLMVHWGRIGQAGQFRVRGSGSREECEVIGRKILKRRLSRDYMVIRDGGPPPGDA